MPTASPTQEASPSPPEPAPKLLPHPYLAGLKAAAGSVFAYVLFGTYIGIGALAHDFGFSAHWLAVSTLLVWAAPAQVILISTIGAGAAPLEAAVAVSLSGVRLLPMVVALLPVLRAPAGRTWTLLLPAHFTAISVWVESLRLAPAVPRAQRAAFCSGIGSGFMLSAALAGTAGFFLAAQLPTLLSAGLLFLTPISFLVSVIRNARQLVDLLALALGLAIAPLLVLADVGLDLLWTGVLGGSAAYLVHRLRRRRS
jgi:predicted branched-subunit amino acid permease